MKRALAAAPFVFVAVAAACGSPPPAQSAPSAPPDSVATTAPAASTALPTVDVTLDSVGLDAKAMDRTADACTDFYRFACGSWLDTTKIPEDKPSYFRSFSSIGDCNDEDIRRIVEDAAAGKIATPAGKKVGAYYASCMDTDAIEKAGLKPIEPFRKLIRAINDDRSLVAAVVELHRAGGNVFFSYAEDQDFKDARSVIGEIDQAGLGLPEKDFYLRDDDKSKEIRAAYVAHIEKMEALAGLSAREAKTAAADAMRIETSLAKIRSRTSNGATRRRSITSSIATASSPRGRSSHGRSISRPAVRGRRRTSTSRTPATSPASTKS